MVPDSVLAPVSIERHKVFRFARDSSLTYTFDCAEILQLKTFYGKILFAVTIGSDFCRVLFRNRDMHRVFAIFASIEAMASVREVNFTIFITMEIMETLGNEYFSCTVLISVMVKIHFISYPHKPTGASHSIPIESLL